MTFAAIAMLCAMTSADAVAVVLNSPSATGAKTFAAAKEIVERDAAAGRPLQQFVIGVTTDDKELAERYMAASRGRILALAEKTDNPLAWYLLSLETNDYRLLLRAANGGNVQALNALGTLATQEALKARGPGADTNKLQRVLEKSYGYFRRAAAQRDPNGFVNLGACYLQGLGCQQDMAMAFQCYRSAAEAGHPEAMDNLSAMYQFGHGVEKNTELSLFWGMRGRAVRGDEAAAKWLRERK